MASPVDSINTSTAAFQAAALAAQDASNKVSLASMVTASVTGANAANTNVARNVGDDLRQAGQYTK
ncbi:MAG: hypothetical protein AB1430_14665 [Pseudomonadota bacterium]